MTNLELSNILQNAMSANNGGIWGNNSSLGQFSNARAGKWAMAFNPDVDRNSDVYNMAMRSLNAQQGQALASGSLAALNGATQIIGATKNNAQLADLTTQRGLIQDLMDTGVQDYNSFDQIANDYSNVEVSVPDLSFDTIRGGSTAERVGNTLSSTLSGASAGMTIGGPIGAAVGAATGLVSGIGSWIVGDNRARRMQGILQNQYDTAKAISRMNLQTSTDNLKDRQYRFNYANRAAEGGKIEKKEMSVKEFADMVLKAQRANTITHSSGIVRKHCNGGTMIRIKVK